ncbi:DMT family transporter [Bacillus sp. CGMCC 1.16607]|uniref:DMT family transporter n=1 Tax=Bacillus sp. CGMCC 1.16607 TaxID=3351842 RepID=UPI003640D72F
MKNSAPYIAALLNATIVGLSFLFTKIALEASSPIDTLGYRFLIGWIVLTIYIKAFVKNKRTFQVKNKKTIVSLIILALFYPTLFFSFQAFGLNYTSSAEGGIILAFSPALTAIFASLFLKERVNSIQILFICLSIFGVVYIFLMNGLELKVSQEQLFGILFLLVSCISISGYAVLARYLSVSFSPFQMTYIMVTFGMVFFNLYAIGQKVIKGNLIDYFTLFIKSDFMLAVVFLGIFATMLTSFLSNYILSKIPASKMSIFSNLSTVISILGGAFFLQEEIKIHHVIGSIMIITGVMGTNLYKGKRQIKHCKTENRKQVSH